MNTEVKSIFGDSISVNGEIIPISHIRYNGRSKRFVTWTLLGETPSLSASDEDLYSVASVDIDIFSDGNYLDIIKEVKKKMTPEEYTQKKDIFDNIQFTPNQLDPFANMKQFGMNFNTKQRTHLELVF